MRDTLTEVKEVIRGEKILSDFETWWALGERAAQSLLTSNPEVVAVSLKDLRIIMENASMDGNEEAWAAWDRVKAIAKALDEVLICG